MTELIAVGLNHKSAPVELRERLAIDGDELTRMLEVLRTEVGLREVMLISTCNRVELYGVTTGATPTERPLQELALRRAVEPGLLHGHTFVRNHADAARHIFRVAASLESMVIGEPQILGQVKDAFAKAQASGAVGPILDRCLSLAFKSAKRVRSETEIARGGASVPSVAVDLALRIFGNLGGCTVLIVGAGEMAQQAAVHLRAAGASEIVVVNRSPERGQALADEVAGRYEPWDRLEAQLVRADVVVTSTGSELPVIDRAMIRPVMRARRQRPLFFVDIAVPRDVEPEVGMADHVFLYNVDDLQGIVHDNLRLRTSEAERAAAVVEEEVHAFLQWLRGRSAGPLIAALQRHAREVVDAELKRALKHLPGLEAERHAVLEQFGRAVAQKLLHKPMTAVRKAEAGAGNGLSGSHGLALADALAALFDLEGAAEAPSRGSSTVVVSEAAAVPTPIVNPEPS